MIRILFSEVCNRKSTQRSTLLFHNNMYWKYLGKLTKSDYYIIKRKDSMLIIRRGGTFLPTPGHVRVKPNFSESDHKVFEYRRYNAFVCLPKRTPPTPLRIVSRFNNYCKTNNNKHRYMSYNGTKY